MADINLLARLVNGAVRNVDLTTNTPVVLSIKIGGATNTELTKAILDNLITLQNGSDVGPSLHHHDTRYYTKIQIQANTGTTGSDLVGDDNTYNNFTPTATTVKGALEGIDTAIGNITGSQVRITNVDTTSGYLSAKLVVDVGTNPNNALESTILNPGSNEQLRVRFDASKVSHGALAGLGNDDHTQYILVDGTRAFTGHQSMGGNRLTNLGAPTANSDAATKQYVDNAIEGVKPKEAVRVATTANLTALSGLLTIDGVTLVDGDRVLVKDQSNSAENGIYIAAAGTWSRAADFDQVTPINEIRGAYVAVMEGVSNAGKIFVCNSNPTTIGTDPITFVFFNSIATLNAGDGIDITGTTISVDHDGEGLQFNSGQLSLELDGTTLSKSAAGLKVADGGITSTQLANGAVTTNKIADDAVTSLKIADNAVVTNKINNQAVTTNKIADDAITTVKIADSAVTTIKINNGAVTEDKISTSVAGSGLSGGGGTPLSVISAPLLRRVCVAGESFAANTSFIVRWARNSETAGRVYKADYDASTNDNFYAIGIALSTAAISSGQDIPVIMFGTHTLGSNDANFAAADVGKPVFLTANGGFSINAPVNADQAVFRIGIVEDVNKIFVQPQLIGVL